MKKYDITTVENARLPIEVYQDGIILASFAFMVDATEFVNHKGEEDKPLPEMICPECGKPVGFSIPDSREHQKAMFVCTVCEWRGHIEGVI